MREVLAKLRDAKRPVVYAGNGTRLSGGYEAFRRAVEALGVPVCTYWDAIDLIETDHPLYVGRGGNMEMCIRDRPQYNIDVSKLEEARSEKTKAVMIAHTLGNPFDLSAVKAFCDKYNLWLVEDNCDALGTQYLSLIHIYPLFWTMCRRFFSSRWQV